MVYQVRCTVTGEGIKATQGSSQAKRKSCETHLFNGKLLQRKLDPVELWAPAVKASCKTCHSVSEKPSTENRRVTVRLTYKGSRFLHVSPQTTKHRVVAYRAKLSMCFPCCNLVIIYAIIRGLCQRFECSNIYAKQFSFVKLLEILIVTLREHTYPRRVITNVSFAFLLYVSVFVKGERKGCEEQEAKTVQIRDTVCS